MKFVALLDEVVSRLIEVFTKFDEIRICKMIVEVLDLISTEICTIEELKDLILKSDGRKKKQPLLNQWRERQETVEILQDFVERERGSGKLARLCRERKR